MKLLPAALQSVSAGKAEAVPNPAHPAARCQPGGGCCHLVKALTRFYPRIGGLFPWAKAPSLLWARRCIAEHFSSLAPPLFLLLHHSSSFSTALPHPLPFFLLLLCSSSSTTSPPPPLFFLLLHLFLHHPGRCQLPAASSVRDLPAAPSAQCWPRAVPVAQAECHASCVLTTQRLQPTRHSLHQGIEPTWECIYF